MRALRAEKDNFKAKWAKRRVYFNYNNLFAYTEIYTRGYIKKRNLLKFGNPFYITKEISNVALIIFTFQ